VGQITRLGKNKAVRGGPTPCCLLLLCCLPAAAAPSPHRRSHPRSNAYAAAASAHRCHHHPRIFRTSIAHRCTPLIRLPETACGALCRRGATGSRAYYQAICEGTVPLWACQPACAAARIESPTVCVRQQPLRCPPLALRRACSESLLQWERLRPLHSPLRRLAEQGAGLDSRRCCCCRRGRQTIR
jgi:hypothetical protein